MSKDKKIKIKLESKPLKTRSVDDSLNEIAWLWTKDEKMGEFLTKEEYFKLKKVASEKGYKNIKQLIRSLIE